jgi:lipopolysaccharide transport system permease protein
MTKVKTYTPDDYRKYRITSNIRKLFSDLSEFSTLLKWLIRVGLTQQYKRSFLGVAWLFISPFFSILLWVLLVYTGMLNPGDTKIPYVAYVFLSNAMWGFFISFYKSISETYTGRGGELLHNSFPHVIVIIEKIVIAIVNFSIPLVLSIFVLLLFNVSFSWTSILFPITLIPLMCLGIALGFFFSILKIVALDLTTFFDHSLEILKFITPVVFATTVNNETLQMIMKYNPLTYLINFPRSVLLGQGFPDLNIFLICSLGSLLCLLFAYRFFTISSPVVFEKISV